MESDDDDVGRGRDREGEADEEVDDTVALLSDVRDDVAGDGTATRERSRERGGARWKRARDACGFAWTG